MSVITRADEIYYNELPKDLADLSRELNTTIQKLEVLIDPNTWGSNDRSSAFIASVANDIEELTKFKIKLAPIIRKFT